MDRSLPPVGKIASNRLKKLFSWKMALFVGAEIYVLSIIIYLVLGNPNADEAWYLYASKLIMEGKVPYRDFAYTQTPLLPYIYAIPQLFVPASLYLGRVTSALLAGLNFFLSIKLAHKYAGVAGAGLTALLFCSSSFTIYFSVIVKTYGLTSVLFILTFYVLTTPRLPENQRILLAVFFSFMAAMVRLSAVFFWLPVVVYGFGRFYKKPIQLLTLTALCFVLLGSAFTIGSLDWQATQWGLLTHHQAKWGDAPIAQVLSTTASRVISLLQKFDVYTFFWLLLGYSAWSNQETRNKAKQYLLQNPPILVVTTGILLFSASYLVGGDWNLDYLAPTLLFSFPVAAIFFCHFYNLQTDPSGKFLLQAAAVAVLLLTWLDITPIDLNGGQPPIEEIKEVAVYVAEHSEPSDNIFALEAQWVAIEAKRSILPGLNMSWFSYQNMGTQEAQRLHLVNGEIVLAYLQACTAQIVLLTDLDWQLFEITGHKESIYQVLSTQYTVGLSKNAFGQHNNTVTVYHCRLD